MNVMQIMFLSLTLSSMAQAFTLNSQTDSNLKGWANSDLQLNINSANCPAGLDVTAIIQDAADVWNNVPDAKIHVSVGQSTAGTSMSSPPTVYCETNFQTVVGANQNAVPGAAAVVGSTGRVTQGILYLNVSLGQANIANFDGTILRVILAHEIGHILGLGHSSDTTALMYYDASAKTQLSLSQDDMDGISYLYPSNELNGDKIAGCGRVNGPTLPPGTGGVLGALLAILLPLVVWANISGVTVKCTDCRVKT